MELIIQEIAKTISENFKEDFFIRLKPEVSRRDHHRFYACLSTVGMVF